MLRDLRRNALLGLALLGLAAPTARADYFVQSNLVSDGFVPAATIDKNLVNPWGVSNGPGGPFWVSNAGSNTSTLYDGLGTKSALTVDVPGGPTGQVFNGVATDFLLPNGSNAPVHASFLFNTLGGGLYGWSGATGVVAEGGNAAASYTGLALGASNSGNVLYAADNNSTHIDVYDNAFHSLTGNGGAFSNKFVDSSLPSNFQAFNVVNLNGMIYVTYNSLNGGGVIDEFDNNGNFLKRLATDLTGKQLAGPWSLAMAPVGFGQFGGDLLVSNNDDGTIAALNPATGAFLGDLTGADGKPIVNDGIWTIEFGGSVKNTDPNTLYIFAGINNEQDGLIAALVSVPEPNSALLAAIGGASAIAIARRRRGWPRA